MFTKFLILLMILLLYCKVEPL